MNVTVKKEYEKWENSKQEGRNGYYLESQRYREWMIF